MKGSEKQIKWAESIISEARETFVRNIARQEAQLNGPAAALAQRTLDIWMRLRDYYEASVANIDSAAFVIDNRTALDSSRVIYQFNQINDMVSRGRKTLDEVLPRIK